jgi:hypothetical protein
MPDIKFIFKIFLEKHMPNYQKNRLAKSKWDCNSLNPWYWGDVHIVSLRDDEQKTLKILSFSPQRYLQNTHLPKRAFTKTIQMQNKDKSIYGIYLE